MADKYIKKLADVLCGLIFDRRERDPQAYDTKATVRRIEDGKAYVHIPGGVDETPVDLTIDAKAGDTVQVRVSGGRAWLVGNRTAPPTDDTTARVAQGTAAKAEVRAEQAEDTANAVSGIANSALSQASEAKQIADDTEQHFWFTETGTDTGAHITEVPQEEWSDPSDPNYQSGGNLLARSNGIAVRDGLTELAQFTGSGLNLYDASNPSVPYAQLSMSALKFRSASRAGIQFINMQGQTTGYIAPSLGGNQEEQLSIYGEDGIYVKSDIISNFSLILEGHSSKVGTNGTTTNTTATRGNSTSYAGIGLQVSLPKGVWMLTGTITFASNTTGRRAVRLTDAGTAIACSEVVSPPANGAATALHTSAVVENTTSSNKTYAMQCYQNSGSTQNVTGELRYVRIA